MGVGVGDQNYVTMRIIELGILAVLIGVCHGDIKTWQRDVNFGNPNNWDKGKVPCATDSIKFPESVNVVFLQTNATLKEILLPLNGALVLDNNVKIAFTDDSSVQPECSGEEQTFISDSPESWFNPGNWVGANGPVAVDTESVPCQYDKVVFPTEKLFSVGVDLSTTVGTVSLSGENFVSTMAFSSFLSSPSGLQQFSLSNNPTILLQNSQCGDLTGCVCGNDVEPIRTKICGFKSTCPSLSCRNAPIPVGGCCPVCGAIVTMEYNPQTFNFESVKTDIESKFGLGPATSSNSARRRRQAESDVTMYMSKTIEGKIQMVFTDSGSGSSSGEAAIRLALDVQDDIAQNLDSYGATTVNMQSSEKGTGGLSGGGVTSGGIAGIIIAVIVIICFVSTVIFILMRRNSFGMKDEPLHANSDVEMTTQSLPPGFMQEIPNPAFDSAMRGFDNPMYSTTKENLYADPAEVKVTSFGDEKAGYVVEEKGAISGPNWEEDEDIKAFSNPMSVEVTKESNA